MDWYEGEVRELEELTRRQPIPQSPAVLYGSSSIRLWGTAARDLRVTNIVNRGFGGSTLAACVHFFERLIQPLHPGSLVLYAGDNDMGDGRTADEVIDSLRALLAKLDAAGLGKIPFAFLSVKPSPARAGIFEQIRRVNTVARLDMEARTNRIYIDVFDAMLDPAGRLRPELFLEDGLHMSRAGYEIWVRQISPFRNQLFIRTQQDLHAAPLLLKNSDPGVRQVVQPQPEP